MYIPCYLATDLELLLQSGIIKGLLEKKSPRPGSPVHSQETVPNPWKSLTKMCARSPRRFVLATAFSSWPHPILNFFSKSDITVPVK